MMDVQLIGSQLQRMLTVTTVYLVDATSLPSLSAPDFIDVLNVRRVWSWPLIKYQRATPRYSYHFAEHTRDELQWSKDAYFDMVKVILVAFDGSGVDKDNYASSGRLKYC